MDLKPVDFYLKYNEILKNKYTKKQLFIKFRNCLNFDFKISNFLNKKTFDLLEYKHKNNEDFETINYIMRNIYGIYNQIDLIDIYCELTNTNIYDNSFLILYETKYKIKITKNKLLNKYKNNTIII